MYWRDTYFKKRRFSRSQVLQALRRGRWPDGNLNVRIRYVWPDEGVGLIYTMISTHPEWEDRHRIEFYGNEPTQIKDWYRFRYFETNDGRFGDEHYLDEVGFFIPAGTIVLQEYPEPDGTVVREYIVSADTDNPQPRLDFSEVILLRLPERLAVAA